MAIDVTAAQAGWLVNRAERVIRWHIERGDLPAQKRGRGWAINPEDLERIEGWRVNRARLAELTEKDARTQESMASQIASLRREVDSLKARLGLLERQRAHTGGSEGQESASLDEVASLPFLAAIQPPGRPRSAAYSLTYGASGEAAQGGTFKARTDAARWLTLHGIRSESTPKDWPGWRGVRLDKRDVLALAISLCDPSNHRITWRLKQCGDEGCVCKEMLEGSERSLTFLDLPST